MYGCQYSFIAPSCVWVCNGVEILKVPMSCYFVVPLCRVMAVIHYPTYQYMSYVWLWAM